MVARRDVLPAVPARDDAISPLTHSDILRPIYGTKELPVAGGRVAAMLFRAGALIGEALAEIAGIPNILAGARRRLASGLAYRLRKLRKFPRLPRPGHGA